MASTHMFFTYADGILRNKCITFAVAIMSHPINAHKA